jgi:hypothetical protein
MSLANRAAPISFSIGATTTDVLFTDADCEQLPCTKTRQAGDGFAQNRTPRASAVCHNRWVSGPFQKLQNDRQMEFSKSMPTHEFLQLGGIGMLCRQNRSTIAQLLSIRVDVTEASGRIILR